MPTSIEAKVFKLISAIEVPRDTGKVIEAMGTEAVTVVSDAALGTYPDLRPKVRSTAVTVLGGMSHPQAREALLLLINDPRQDLQIRAMRAAGRQKNANAGKKIAQVIENPAATPVVAAEAVKALDAIGSPEARAALEAYVAASPNLLPHRSSQVVQSVFERLRGADRRNRLRGRSET